MYHLNFLWCGTTIQVQQRPSLLKQPQVSGELCCDFRELCQVRLLTLCSVLQARHLMPSSSAEVEKADQTSLAVSEGKWKGLLLSSCFYFLFLLAYIKLLENIHREVSVQPQVTRKISPLGRAQRPPNDATIPNGLFRQVPGKSSPEPSTKLSVVSTAANMSTAWWRPLDCCKIPLPRHLPPCPQIGNSHRSFPAPLGSGA